MVRRVGILTRKQVMLKDEAHRVHRLLHGLLHLQVLILAYQAHRLFYQQAAMQISRVQAQMTNLANYDHCASHFWKVKHFYIQSRKSQF